MRLAVSKAGEAGPPEGAAAPPAPSKAGETGPPEGATRLAIRPLRRARPARPALRRETSKSSRSSLQGRRGRRAQSGARLRGGARARPARPALRREELRPSASARPARPALWREAVAVPRARPASPPCARGQTVRGRLEIPKRASPALFRDSRDGSEATPDMVETTSGLGERPARSQPVRSQRCVRFGGTGRVLDFRTYVLLARIVPLGRALRFGGG